MELHDLVSSLRDLVYEYDELISKTKLWYGRINNSNLREFYEFLREIDEIMTKTMKILTIYNDSKKILGKDQLSEYIVTYYMYLKLVSIPYTRDLLNDIRNKAMRRNIKLDRLDQTIERVNQLLSKY